MIRAQRGCTVSFRRWSVLVWSAVLTACAAGSSAPPPPPPAIQFKPSGNGWSAEPLNDALTRVSNNGFGYTGEIDRYELVAPATGRLLISLSWDATGNYDLIVASDEQGRGRLVEGLEDTGPEYVSLDVVAGQELFVFVAGWTGDPGPYLLETILLPPGTPAFALVSGPDLTAPWPANRPLTFTFNTELDPAQIAAERVYFVRAGALADGEWCIEGRDLTFYPRLPETAGDPGGLLAGAEHTLQFPRAARGLRAVTGEYLTDVVSVIFDMGPHADLSPGAPPIVTGVAPNPGLPYGGEAITLAVSEALVPESFVPQMVSIAANGAVAPYPFTYRLTQQYLCSGGIEVRLFLAPSQAPAGGATIRLTIPGTAMGLSRAAGAANALNGGAGFTADFLAP
jgi:hypothetical protein